METTTEALTILLVESDELEASRVRRAIESVAPRSSVDVATDLTDARDYVARCIYDCVFADNHVRGGLGLDLLSDLVDTPLIVLTDTEDEELADAAIAAGARGYVIKGTLEGAVLLEAIHLAREATVALRGGTVSAPATPSGAQEAVRGTGRAAHTPAAEAGRADTAGVLRRRSASHSGAHRAVQAPRPPMQPALQAREATGSQRAVTGSQRAVTGSQRAVTGSQPAVTGSQPAVTGSQRVVTGSQRAVTGSQRAVTGSQPAVGGEAARRPALRTFIDLAADIEQTPFPALLYKLYANQMTGVLSIGVGRAARTIYFDSGQPVYAESNLHSDSLSSVLVTNGFLPLETVEHIVSALGDEELLGEKLLELGVLLPRQLLEALNLQVHERCVSCFAIKDGTYRFVPTTDWMGEVQAFPQDPIALIDAGIRRHRHKNEMASELAKKVKHYVSRTEKFDEFLPHLPTSELERAWLEQISGTTTLGQLAQRAGRGVLEFLLLVYVLRSADMIVLSRGPRPNGGRPEEKPAPEIRRPFSGGSRREVSGSQPAARLSTRELDQLAKNIVTFYVRLPHVDYWQLLGLARGAPADEVRAAYRRCREQLRPETFPLLDPVTRDGGERVFEALKRAFNTLVDPDERAKYMRTPSRVGSEDSSMRREQSRGAITHLNEQRRASETPAPAPDPGRPVKALERTDHWTSSLQEVRQALRTAPEDPALVALEAWILFNATGRTSALRAHCVRRLEYALQRDPRRADPHYYMGRIAELEADFETALAQYDAAVSKQPDHDMAVRRRKRLLRRLGRITGSGLGTR
jgi:DNA-binding NarL/FixJ family response regulator